MRIFKNRGDIFFSKTNKEKSTEQKILLIALVIIVLFSLVFMICVGAKNDFSVKKFFEPENLSTTQAVEESTIELPQVSGKTNYIVTVSEKESLLFAELIQVDFDNTSYKVCTLKPSTEYDGSTLSYIYSHSGVQNVKSAVENMFSTSIDYYIDFEKDKFADYYDSLGEVNYAVSSDIKYKNNKTTVPYTVRIKAGEQVIKGSQAVNLVRYYLESGNNQSGANDILLTSLSKQLNAENFVEKDSFFQDFVTKANTNITVRDYAAADDKITVLCNSQNGISIYGAEIKYKNNKMEIFDMISKEELDKYMSKANLVITHGGVGSIIMALEKGKKVIAVPRLHEYGEHVNDHQRQIIKMFGEKNYLIGIQNVEDLPEAIKESETFEPNEYKNNNQKMLNIIEDFIEKV